MPATSSLQSTRYPRRGGAYELGAVWVRIVCRLAEVRADNLAHPLRRPEGIDIGGKIEDFAGGNAGGFRRAPNVAAVRPIRVSHRAPPGQSCEASTSGGIASTISHVAPSVSPV